MERRYKILEITFDEFLALLKGKIPDDAKIASFSFCFDTHKFYVTLESGSYFDLPNDVIVTKYRLDDEGLMGDFMTKNSRPDYEIQKRKLDPEDEEYLYYLEVVNGKVRDKEK